MNTNDDDKPDLLERVTEFLRNHNWKEIIVIVAKSIVSSPALDSSTDSVSLQRAHERLTDEFDRHMQTRGITVTDVTMGYRYGNNPMIGRTHNSNRF